MKQTQNDMIRNALKSGRRITSLDALNEFGCLRLASRISDLRQLGMRIEVNMVKGYNNKKFAEYYLVGGEEK